jgi:hypothetical protein
MNCETIENVGYKHAKRRSKFWEQRGHVVRWYYVGKRVVLYVEKKSENYLTRPVS